MTQNLAWSQKCVQFGWNSWMPTISKAQGAKGVGMGRQKGLTLALPQFAHSAHICIPLSHLQWGLQPQEFHVLNTVNLVSLYITYP